MLVALMADKGDRQRLSRINAASSKSSGNVKQLDVMACFKRAEHKNVPALQNRKRKQV